MAALLCKPAAGMVQPTLTARPSSSSQVLLAPIRCQPCRASRRRTVAARAERGSDSNFLAGFVVGGVVFGALGFLLAPQISKTLLNEDARLRLPRFLEDEAPKDPEATKQDLIDKIAQLNASIDEVAAQLKSKDTEPATLS
ncbi:hypothetical protein OEZ86_005623 [Tetradesmus obliquus]|uniref:Uncharacterized protein n=1 Tax=Tetradesmus obliquus TaxID=3088 RepID=A0A383VW02_TETOB|nr:hypothetical protein OEZ86_005623 [Tetradesmus obliquus]|eukprot:jgi/Sobl393_1/18912/SZX69043.1